MANHARALKNRYLPLSYSAESSPVKSLVRKQFFSLKLLIILTFGLAPLYLFSSGKPQLVDVPILILMGIMLFMKFDTDKFINKSKTTLLLYVIWAVLINFVYFTQYSQDYSFLFVNGELVYTFLIFSFFSKLFRKIISENLLFLYAGLILSILLCFLIKGNYEEGIVRSALSFNNPNQLGYFTVILISFVVILMQYKRECNLDSLTYSIADIILIIVAHIFSLLAVSRGAIFSILILDIWLIINIKDKVRFFSVGILLLMCVVVIFLHPNLLENKLEGRGRKMDLDATKQEIKGRIWHQMSVMHSFQYIIGRGAGAIQRDRDQIGRLKGGIGEVHNIFGQIFRSYGLIGLALFLNWLLRLIWSSRILPGSLWVWTALIVYNMSHNGVRFRMFWFLMALIIFIISDLQRQKIKREEEEKLPSAIRRGFTSGEC
jgi:hypothetical protein